MLTDAMQTVRHAARTLRRNPGFTFVGVVTLALGLGANTDIFSIVYALVLRPLPYAEPGRLVLLSERDRDGERSSMSYPNYSNWRERARSFEGMASVARTALISDGMWRERFGGDANAIGGTLRLDGEPYEVIGVLPPGFEYFGTADVCVPIGLVLRPQSGMMDRGSSLAFAQSRV